MKNKQYVIGISCIGSGVGQSIINSLRLSKLPIKTVGLGTNPFAYGAYDCDIYDYTPSIYEDNYLEEIIKKCKKYKIDLLIPGLDDEVFILSKNEKRLKQENINAIFSNSKLISICRDKEKMSNILNKIENVFVKSFNSKNINKAISSGETKLPLIVKPRGGFASRNIQIIDNKNDLNKITKDYIIQELAIPSKNDPNHKFYLEQISKKIIPQVSEISIQIVFDQDNNLIGRMASYNKLNNGVPIEVIPFKNKKVDKIIDKLIPIFKKLGIKGPLNIQGRITDNGFKIFEMNPRFTGITGLRAIMGFNEVEACVKEWLKINKGKNKLKFNYNRFGLRQTADKSLSIERNQRVTSLFKQINKNIIKTKKIVLITGASGYLGQNIISKLTKENNFELWILTSNKKKTQNILLKKTINYFDHNDLNNGILQLGNVDILLHLGFARPYCKNSQISDSLKFTFNLFNRIAMHQIPAIINISSQSVYGLETKPLWTEKTTISPSNTYGQAKYAAELFLNSLNKINNQLKYTSIRLATLGGGAKGLTELDFLSKITRRAFNGEIITVIDGNQQMERLDIRDAVGALIKIIKTDPQKWKPVYNLGSNKTHLLREIVNKVVEISTKYSKKKKSKIIIDPKKVSMKFGMNSSLFYKDFNWKPKYSIDDTIESYFNFFKNEK